MVDNKNNEYEIININNDHIEFARFPGNANGEFNFIFLHPELGVRRSDEFINQLSNIGSVIAPSHPGFGRSARPDRFTTADDVAYLYLDFLEKLALPNVVLVGSSFGGWIAAEMATKKCDIAGLVLLNPVGIKQKGREEREIFDIFNVPWDEFEEVAFADQSKVFRDYPSARDSDLYALAKAREAIAVYGWLPYMHNPKLRDRLRRIDVPTLCVAGAADRITAPEYTHGFASGIPGASVVTIPGAGHFPHIEKPSEVAAAIQKFLQVEEEMVP